MTLTWPHIGKTKISMIKVTDLFSCKGRFVHTKTRKRKAFHVSRAVASMRQDEALALS